MVSFSCEICSDIFKKPKLDSHAARCRGAYYTCIDCSKTFTEGQWKGHTSCITEAEKYQGSFYKPEKGKGKDKKKKESPEAIAAPVTKANQPEAKDTPMDDAPPAESPDQPKPSKKEKRKSKKDKKDKKKSKDTPAVLETSPDSAPTAEAVDNKKKRKSVSAEDTPAKKRKKGEKARMSQEKLAELVGEEELGLAGFLERLEKEVGSAHDKVSKGAALQGLRVKVDGGRVVLSFGG